ncbi:DUF3303 domain-containing protein [Methanococcoides seepicolus]|uniref:DUF3303 family protein n=1 Tax=Methanococcoides seepicolus TaxID=2828780 RepID=A0A9E5DCV9_9EURY|nr:DUF3303 family protein [Methanococcoides seepicolus]MCM1988002.1 DUF3303 family protein [Methanococcoides seepicolus]
MLFVDITTWDPKDNEEVHKRFENWEDPEGIKMIGQWLDIASCRIVQVYDVENTEAYAASLFPWRDICYIDSFPVMDPEEAIKFADKHPELFE